MFQEGIIRHKVITEQTEEKITLEGIDINLHLKDIIKEEIHVKNATFFVDVNMTVCLIDVTNQGSVESCKCYFSYADRFSNDLLYKVIVGNKIDLERVVTKQQGEDVAKECNADYFEISNKTGEGITEFSEYLKRKMYDRFIVPKLKQDRKNKEGKCYIC